MPSEDLSGTKMGEVDSKEQGGMALGRSFFSSAMWIKFDLLCFGSVALPDSGVKAYCAIQNCNCYSNCQCTGQYSGQIGATRHDA
jgi:hypothetical protein